MCDPCGVSRVAMYQRSEAISRLEPMWTHKEWLPSSGPPNNGSHKIRLTDKMLHSKTYGKINEIQKSTFGIFWHRCITDPSLRLLSEYMAKPGILEWIAMGWSITTSCLRICHPWSFLRRQSRLQQIAITRVKNIATKGYKIIRNTLNPSVPCSTHYKCRLPYYVYIYIYICTTIYI